MGFVILLFQCFGFEWIALIAAPSIGVPVKTCAREFCEASMSYGLLNNHFGVDKTSASSITIVFIFNSRFAMLFSGVEFGFSFSEHCFHLILPADIK